MSLSLFIGLLAVVPAIAADSVRHTDTNDYFYRVLIGVLAHDIGGLWSGTHKEDGIDINGEIVFGRPHFSIFAGTLRPNLGLSINCCGNTSKLYGGFLWEIKNQSGIFLITGLGAAVHNGELHTDNTDKKSLGSRVLFRIPIELGYQITEHHSVSLMFDHVSNAGLAGSNEGLDTFGIRCGYLF